MGRWFCIQSVGAGDMVAVTYSGWIVGADGKLGSAPYDSNAGRDPLKLAIGAGSHLAPMLDSSLVLHIVTLFL
jgi:hypothetical protein